MKRKNWIALLLCAGLAMSTMGSTGVVAKGSELPTKNVEQNALAPEISVGTAGSGTGSYDEYLARQSAGLSVRPNESITLPAEDFTVAEPSGAYLAPYMGRNGLYLERVGETASWSFQVEQEGWYQLGLTFGSVGGQYGDIVMDIFLDGELPHDGTQNINLRRLYMDETYLSMTDNAFRTNTNGDEIRPALVEQLVWQTQTVRDPKDRFAGPLLFYLSAGEHVISLKSKGAGVVIGALTFFNDEQAAAYETVKQSGDAAGAKDSSGYMSEYEAEKSFQKNALTLFATYDTARAHVTPASPVVINYNTIGKNTWKEIGQWISWEFEVPQDGYYHLAFKVKQYDKTNAYSVRSVAIDGRFLYEEMRLQKFPYDTGWYVQALENEAGEPLKVFLNKGVHTLRMEADIDEPFAEILRVVDDASAGLQKWYREIIKITGFNADPDRVSIDTNRDFKLEQTIPGLLDGLAQCKMKLDECYSRIAGMQDISASSASILKEVSSMLEKLIAHPGRIAKRIETLRANISTLATWSIEMRSQPLVMDKFYVYSPDCEMPQIDDGMFAQMGYRFRLFLNSFFHSYSSVASTDEVQKSDVTLRVWISTADITTTGASSGRDQAIILKKLIDESFTTLTGISAEVSLVTGADTLVQAVLAGEGPDVALLTSVDTPVNLAMRGLLLDLSRFEGYEEVLTQFTESAQVPFRYKEGLYAFPETQNFNVLFYRSDVYDELGLEPPKTWDEFYEQIIYLFNQNYMVGVPQNQNIFETFLYQAGSTFYTEDLSQSTFNTNEALTAFRRWTDLYTKYSLPLQFDFFNRFRSGEMAMAVMPYNQVNYLYSAAPELDGLWDMAMIPGTMGENDVIDHTETSTSTGCVALADTEYPKEAYEFLRWWVSADTQTSFGIQVEQTLGVAARYATANLEAFEKLPWESGQADVLRAQRASTVAVEQIPGSYYIARNLAFAFRGVVYNHKNLRETLNKYTIEINKELERKQKEFSY